MNNTFSYIRVKCKELTETVKEHVGLTLFFMIISFLVAFAKVTPLLNTYHVYIIVVMNLLLSVRFTPLYLDGFQ